MKLIEIDKLSYSFDGKKDVLKDIVLGIEKGEVVGLSGDSGSGKSTLAGCIAGIHREFRGNICYSGDIEVRSSHIAGVHLIFQDPYSSINPRFSVAQAVAEGFTCPSSEERDVLVEKLLTRAGLSPSFLHKRVGFLSGGERQRVAIARGLASNPSLMIFDEATANLDLISQRNILSVIQSLKGSGMAILIISHDIKLLSLICDRVVKIHQGSLV